MPNGLEKCVNFTINIKLTLIDNFYFLIKGKGFYPCDYMSDLKKYKEELPSQEMLYSFLIDKTTSDQEYEHLLNVWNRLVNKMWNKM